jgi:HK97 family phage portal protein
MKYGEYTSTFTAGGTVTHFINQLIMAQNFLQRALSKFVGGVPTFWSMLLGQGYTDYTRWDKRNMIEQAYERNPAVAAIVDSVAELVSALPVYVEYRGKKQTFEHPILDALDRSYGGRKSIIDTTTRYLMITGEGYLQKVLYGEGMNAELTSFVSLPSQFTQPIQGTPIQPIEAFQYLQYGRTVIPFSDMVYVRRQSLSEYFHGNAPVLAIAEWIDFQNSSANWNKNVAKRGGMPQLIARMPNITPEEAQEWKRKWGEMNGGAVNAGLPAIDGSRDTEYLNLNFKPQEAEWSKGIEISNRLIAMRWGYPSELLNDPSGKTYANVTEATRTLYRNLVLPMARLIYDSINRDCSHYYADRPMIRIDEDAIPALAEDRAKLAETVVKATGKPFLTVNEGREMFKYPASTDKAHNEIGTAFPFEKPPISPATLE